MFLQLASEDRLHENSIDFLAYRLASSCHFKWNCVCVSIYENMWRHDFAGSIGGCCYNRIWTVPTWVIFSKDCELNPSFFSSSLWSELIFVVLIGRRNLKKISQAIDCARRFFARISIRTTPSFVKILAPDQLYSKGWKMKKGRVMTSRNNPDGSISKGCPVTAVVPMP